MVPESDYLRPAGNANDLRAKVQFRRADRKLWLLSRGIGRLSIPRQDSNGQPKKNAGYSNHHCL